MTQIKNPENGNQKGTVTIVGYSERFFMNAAPPVHIMKDLLEIGKVEKNGKIELDIDNESRIVFKCNQCSRRFSPIVVKPGDWVVLIYERAIDCIVPIVSDREHYLQAKRSYLEAQRQKIIQMRMRVLKRLCIISLVVLAVCVIWGVSAFIHEYLEQSKRTYRSNNFSYVVENSSEDNQSANKESMREISRHPWKRVISGDPYGACILEVLSFAENGNGNCREIRYAGGNAVSASNFSFSYYIEGEKVYCSGTWEYVFRGGKLYDKQNHPYKSGSDLIY